MTLPGQSGKGADRAAGCAVTLVIATISLYWLGVSLRIVRVVGRHTLTRTGEA